MKKIKWIVICTVFLEVLGLTIMIPAMPNLVGYYHTNYFMISFGMTIYSLFGLFSTPILGALSDKFGRKPVLLYSVLGSALSYLVLAVSGNIWLFLFGRIINGATAGNIGALQSILTDISEDHKDRAANFGLFGVIFGLGFVVGPAIGALALRWGIAMPFWISFVLTVVNLACIFFFVPETNKLINKLKKIKTNIVHIFGDMFLSPERHYYLVFTILTFALMIYQMSFLLYLNNHFAVSGTTGGYILGSFGVIMMINQGFFFRNFWLKLSNTKLLYISFIGLFVCYGAAFFINNLWVIIGLVAISGIFQGIFRPVFSSIILGNNKDQVGLINGNLANIGNLAAIVGPLVGGVLIDKNLSPFGLVAFLVLVSYVLWRKYATKSAPTA